MTYQHIYFSENFPDARLEAYIHDTHAELVIDKRKAIIVCPGGGYAFLSEREAEPIALSYAAAGLNVFVLRYSLLDKASGYAPLIEACLAIKYIREHCEELKVDPKYVYITGFSAGGHLSAWAGCMWNSPKVTEHLNGADAKICKPTATLPCYPVITSNPKYGHMGSYDVLVGNCNEEVDETCFSLERYVDKNTSPSFIWHTATDAAVHAMNALLYAEKLCEHGVPFELHIFPCGGHGLALCNKETWIGEPGLLNPYVEQWVKMAIHWVNECPFEQK